MLFSEKDWTTSVIRHKQNHTRIIVIILLIVLIISICSVLWIWNNRLNTAIYLSEQKIQFLQTQLSHYQQQLTTIQTNYQNIQEDTALHEITHQMEDYIATDDFVMNKVYFYKDKAHHLEYLYIDIYNQPDMEQYYTAQGVYTLSANQLKLKCEQMITDTQEYYAEGDFLPEWDQNTVVYLTINNYEIGNNANGNFELTANANNQNP